MENVRKFPFEIVDLEENLNTETISFFSGISSSPQYVRVGPKKFLLNARFRRDADLLWNFAARPDDIWIATYPRSGTTMTQDLIWLIANKFDYEGATTRITNRFPFFDYHIVGPAEDENKYVPAYKFLKEVNDRRFIKAHLPVSLLPANVLECGAKLIYVARHPKDVIVSNFHFAKMLKCINEHESFEKYFDFFVRDLTFWSPFFAHIQEGWELRNEPNVLFMFYEDIIRDIPAAAKQIGEFLNVSVPSEELPKLADYMSFDKFKNNQAVIQVGGAFIRRGKSEGWQNEFTPQLRKQAENWIAENLKNTDLRFPEH